MDADKLSDGCEDRVERGKEKERAQDTPEESFEADLPEIWISARLNARRVSRGLLDLPRVGLHADVSRVHLVRPDDGGR
eukprot:933947-Pleurochrysis_carterae.AAC.1